jgi:hypothetical protein
VSATIDGVNCFMTGVLFLEIALVPDVFWRSESSSVKKSYIFFV